MKNMVRVFTHLFKVTMIVILISHMVSCLNKYLAFNGQTIIKYMESKSIEYPSITICPQYEVAYNETFLAERGIPSVPDYRKGMWFDRAEGKAKMTPEEIFQIAAYNLSQIIRGVTLSYAELKAKDEVYNETNLNQLSWVTRLEYTFGKCFELLLEEKKKDGINSIVITTKMNAYIYFHGPGKFTSPESMSKAEIILGQILFLDMNFDMSVETLSNRCRLYSHTVTFDVCNDNFTAGILKQNVSCRVPYVPGDDDFPICADTETNRVALDVYDTVNGRFSDTCPIPCTKTVFTFGFPFHANGSADEAEGKFYFKQEIKVIEDRIAYDFMSMVSEVGGMTGLLLGWSFMDFITAVSLLFTVGKTTISRLMR